MSDTPQKSTSKTSYSWIQGVQNVFIGNRQEHWSRRWVQETWQLTLMSAQSH